MVEVEAVIRAELERISPLGGREGADWAAVLDRAMAPVSAARRLRRRRLYLAVAVALALVAVAAPALAFRAAIVDFFTASPAPRNVVVDFRQLKVAESLPPGPGPGAQVLPRQARRITSTRVNGTTSVLYVAPTLRGGFCALWTTGASQCLRRSDMLGRSRNAIVGYLAMTPSLGVDTIQGITFVRGSTVELVYGDGATAVIPYVWVTAPIRAGFFLYGVPEARRLGQTRPIAVVVSHGGKTLLRQPIEDVSKTNRIVNHYDRWGAQVQTSPEAVWSKRRLLWSFNLADGSLAEAWVMPSRQGPHRRCVVYSLFGYGCEAVPLEGAPLQLTLAGGGDGTTVIVGEVAAGLRRVKLHFQDGRTQMVAPKEGVIQAKLPSRSYAFGHRLTEAVGVDVAGRRIGSETFDPHIPNTYPCSKPKNYGYGISECP